jgi:glycerophosphoryl diester phosphodiesterase
VSTRALVIAHRGASAYKPENTLPAYQLAIDMRADMIEIDLHTTKDAAVVVAHDAELDRLGGVGEIGEVDLSVLRGFDAGDGEAVPTLDEVLDRFGAAIPFNLELKRGGERSYPGMEAAVARAVRSRGILEPTLFSSFYDPVLARLREAEPTARIALLISRRYPVDVLERAAALGAEAINPEDALVTEAFVDEARSAGLAVNVFTVDDPRRMEELLGWGVDGIFTNVPDRMRALVDAR